MRVSEGVRPFVQLQAKQALVLAGKKGEERLVAQVERLHAELRSAWMAHETQHVAPYHEAHDLDEKLRTEMMKIARADNVVCAMSCL